MSAKPRKIHIVFHDAGGGHRNAAFSLKSIIEQQNRPWQVELVQFQELTDRLDVLRRVTGYVVGADPHRRRGRRCLRRRLPAERRTRV